MDLPLARLDDLLAYDPPFLTAKLLKLKIVRSEAEARALFAEVKKYLVLCELHRASLIPMFSRRVDEVWHQFVLFTAAYDAFAREYFGKFVHHDPVEADGGAAAGGAMHEMTFAEFRAAYEDRFGALPDAWFDERSVTPASRVVRAAWRSPFRARLHGGCAELVLDRVPAEAVCRTNARALEALTFLASCDAFHVRELPGLDDGDRVVLAASLVERGVLFVLP